MGLDLYGYEDDYLRIKYSSFNELRRWLAELALGIDLSDMRGFGGCRPWDEVDDDLAPLLNHSDFDGDLTPEECARVAPRLREVLEPTTPRDDHFAFLREWGLSFAELMERAAEHGTGVEFA